MYYECGKASVQSLGRCLRMRVLMVHFAQRERRVYLCVHLRKEREVVKREVVVDRRGLEPRTLGLRVPCSTN